MAPITNRPNVIRTNDVSRVGEDKLAGFMATAIPLGVGAPKGLIDGSGKPLSADTVAFQMRSPDGSQKIDLAWDKASDKMFMLKGGKMTEVSPEVRAAALDRLTAANLAGRNARSEYSQMRDDMVKVKGSTLERPKVPEMPKTSTDVDTSKIYEDEKPVVKTEQKPEAKTDVKPEVKTEQKPEVKTDVKPEVKTEQKPAITKDAFLKDNSARVVSTAELKQKGFNAAEVARADANGDGAISGDEWKGVWSAIDSHDKNKDAGSVDPNNAKSFVAVDKRLTAVKDAKTLTEAPYNKADLARVHDYLENASGVTLHPLTDAECAKKGLPKGSAELTFSQGGNSDATTVNVYFNATEKRLYKELSDPKDGKNTPLVPLTDAEQKLMEKNYFLQNNEYDTKTDGEYALLREIGLAGH